MKSTRLCPIILGATLLFSTFSTTAIASYAINNNASLTTQTTAATESQTTNYTYEEAIDKFHMIPATPLPPVSENIPELNEIISSVIDHNNPNVLLLDSYESSQPDSLSANDIVAQFRLLDKSLVSSFTIKNQNANNIYCATLSITATQYKNGERFLSPSPFFFRYISNKDCFEYLTHDDIVTASLTGSTALNSMTWRKAPAGTRIDQALRLLFSLRKDPQSSQPQS